jgi:MraZ protein
MPSDLPNKWVKVEKILMSLPNMNRRVRNMQRLIVGHTAELNQVSQ